MEGSAGWFKPKQKVDHIEFAGKTEFTTEDYSDKDLRVVIYHFKE